MIETVGLIGDPIAHSLSPAMHNAAFAHHGLPDRYALWPTTATSLAQRIDLLRAPDMRGANVTVPHKTAVLPMLDQIDQVAAAVGAVNTIVREADGQLLGLNTDIEGFLRALQTVGFVANGQNIVVLGAGGAARAVVYGLLHSGAAAICVINRTLERAESLLADMLATTDADPALRALPPDDAHVVPTIADADLIVNATSVGLHGELPITPEAFDRHQLVVDLIYRPTPLLQAAAERGAHTQDGLEMLVQQGALAFETWTGCVAPIGQMRRAAHKAIKERV